MKLSDNRYEVRVTNYEVKNPRVANLPRADNRRQHRLLKRFLFDVLVKKNRRAPRDC